MIRKGHGRLADATISDPRQNDRAGVINPTDNGMGVGAQRGPQPWVGSDGPVSAGWDSVAGVSTSLRISASAPSVRGWRGG